MMDVTEQIRWWRLFFSCLIPFFPSLNR
jgi:hypothetical protein